MTSSAAGGKHKSTARPKPIAARLLALSQSRRWTFEDITEEERDFRQQFESTWVAMLDHDQDGWPTCWSPTNAAQQTLIATAQRTFKDVAWKPAACDVEGKAARHGCGTGDLPTLEQPNRHHQLRQ